jgi:hypothetical protein
VSDAIGAAVIAAVSSVVGSVLTFIVGIRQVKRSVSTASGTPLGPALDGRLEQIEHRLTRIEDSLGRRPRPSGIRGRTLLADALAAPRPRLSGRDRSIRLVVEVVPASDDVSEAIRRRQLIAIRRFLREISARRGRSQAGAMLPETEQEREASST